MSQKQLLLLLGGMICVSLALYLYTSLATPDRAGGPQTAVDENHCPDCGRELPRGAVGECPFCKLQQAGKTKDKGGGGVQIYTTTHYVLIGCILFLTLGGGYLILRSTGFKIRRRKRDEATFYTRCPKCKRKVRYAASQAGRTVLCPTCRWTLTLSSSSPRAG